MQCVSPGGEGNEYHILRFICRFDKNVKSWPHHTCLQSLLKISFWDHDKFFISSRSAELDDYSNACVSLSQPQPKNGKMGHGVFQVTKKAFITSLFFYIMIMSLHWWPLKQKIDDDISCVCCLRQRH